MITPQILAMYLNCKFRFKLVGPLGDDDGFSGWMNLVPEALPECFKNIDRVQLQLRPLSSMTEEETKALSEIGYSITWPNFYLRAGDGNTYRNISMLSVAEAIKYLLSKGFDLFGLIESGDAIDSSKL